MKNNMPTAGVDNAKCGQIRVRRVGSITAGISLISFGIMFLLRIFTDAVSYQMVFKFWPVIIIGIGAEILTANTKRFEIKYDRGAVCLMAIMMVFASGMAIASEVMMHMQVNIG